ncbi:MAG: DUF1634 domain-containing protein [Bacteroidota bacterium]|nr:DUF1634 domain-containing protein [Bacteroidota bacterium]
MKLFSQLNTPNTRKISASESSKWTDQRVEVIIGNLLRLGVIIAAAVAFLGGIFFLFTHGVERPDYRFFNGEPSPLRSIGGVISEVFSLHSKGVIQLGLLLLILTPIARVAFSIFAFLEEKDHLYVVVTLIVLMFLLFSLSGGKL